jgi:hypothetical protein
LYAKKNYFLSVSIAAVATESIAAVATVAVESIVATVDQQLFQQF